MKNLINSSTALTLSFALAVPNNVMAQGEPPACNLNAETVQFPCEVNGTVLYDLEELGALMEAQGATEGETETITEERQVAPEVDEAELERQAAEEAARQEAERQAAEQAAAEEAARQEAERQAAEQAAAEEAERQAAEQAAAEEAERQAAEQAAGEEAERQAAEQAAAEEAERQAAEKAAQQAEEEARRAAEQEELRRQARAEELAAAAAAAAAAEEGTAQADVVTEEVAEEEVRRADEEFETAVTGDDPQVQEDDDDGLSKFEKALLLGLGAAVVGTVLKNGDRVISNSGDRVVVEDPNGDLRVLKDDDALIRRPGDEVRTETFNDGSSRTVVTKPDGSQIVTIRGRDGTVLRRISIDPQGREYVLFDDLQQEEEIVINDLPQVQDTGSTRVSVSNDDALRAALRAEMNAQQQGRFSLRQVREIRQVRALAPELELDAVQFATGSAAIRPEQARSLANIGRTLAELISQDPRTVILVEGHTDAVGSATYNLALSDRRAETVALALTEYFGVPPENMVTQGYGEAALKVPTLLDEPANRRAVVRNITPLLR